MTRKIAIIAVVLIGGLTGCATDSSVGSNAPDFTATDGQGNAVSLAAYEGQVLILDFWAVW